MNSTLSLYLRKYAAVVAVSATALTGVGVSLDAATVRALAADTVTISAIQGTTDTSPLNKQTVTTSGVVTAAYPTGGLRGYYIQTPGARSTDGSSDGIFVYSADTVGQVKVGDYVQVTGTVGEYQGQTQITVKAGAMTQLDKTTVDAITPLKMALPEDPAARESLEGMLIQPTGDITITDNYTTNRYGEIGLVNGKEPLKTATDVVAPGAEATAYEAENAKKAYVLDDGATVDYTRGASSTPAAYLGGQNPVRAGESVTFTQPVVLSYSFNLWRLQPTSPVDGTTDPSALPATWTNNREETPVSVGGEQSIASFNVLNYFSTTGDSLTGCTFYVDRDKNPITVNSGCDARGAANIENFERQQAKIVAAINKINTSVLSLEEIENSSVFGKNRDDALNNLVAALNKAAGYEKWTAIASPANLPATEDVIRTAFIYQKDKVTPVGDSEILSGDGASAFSNARLPLAQAFKAANADANDEQFVAIVNHFKSKGSGSGVNADQGDGQGASVASRKAQATSLVAFADEQKTKHKTKNVILLGDFNSYKQEDPMKIIEDAGYINQGKVFDAGNTYLYGGRVGSMDQVFFSKEFADNATGAHVWNINSVESIGLEYSRYNNNVTNLYVADQYRSSDHDPELVGFNLSVANPAPIVFTDIKDGDQFYNEVMWLADQGITTGWNLGDHREYRPLQGVERGAMAAFFYRLAGSPDFEAPATPSFKDVPTTHQFYKEIEWMKSTGITTGFWDGTFRPDATVNRDAMAAFFYRAAGSPTYNAPVDSTFKDIKYGDQFYKEVSWMKASGISTGWSDGTYRPLNKVNRDAMAAFIYRFDQNIGWGL